MKIMSKTASFASFLVFLLSAKFAAASRPFGHSHLDLVSDGSDDYFNPRTKPENSSSFIFYKRIDVIDSTERTCEQLYGFLPCSSNLAGHLFLILVYEYLLFRGESLVASGGERIFKILGPGIFGASAFHVLGFLPEALILLASGLLNSKEVAQEYVLTGVGLLAGSTILLLTIIWGTCVIVGCQEFANDKKNNSLESSNHQEHNLFKRLLSRSKGCGLVTDIETSYTARIMVLSAIPFLIIQVPRIFSLSSSSELIFILIALFLSVTFLLAYFFYQIFQPWIEKRRLQYLKQEHLVIDILKHVQNHITGRVLTAKGAPNVLTIRRLFDKTDNDGDNFISVSELKEFLKEIKFREPNLDKDEVTAEIFEKFDLDKDKKINFAEFLHGFKKLINETKHAPYMRWHSRRSLKDLNEVLNPWIEKKREEREIMKHLMIELFEHARSSIVGTLLTEDGKPDENAIRRLFENVDQDKDNSISCSELKELLANVKFGPTAPSVDEAVAIIFGEFDKDHDEMICQEEFVTGFRKWMHKTNHTSLDSEESEDDFYQRTWEQTDILLEEESINRSPLAWTKAVFLLLLGIAMLGLLAEPLIESVQSVSKAANVPSFFISFILVPLATNARIAISAISEASRKKSRITSLTFSEIYGGVFMNNMLGLSVLLSLIYFRGLSWVFSAEVLIVLIVCSILGCTASLNTMVPLWASFVAYLLYPLSLVLVYLLQA